MNEVKCVGEARIVCRLVNVEEKEFLHDGEQVRERNVGRAQGKRNLLSFHSLGQFSSSPFLCVLLLPFVMAET